MSWWTIMHHWFETIEQFQINLGVYEMMVCIKFILTFHLLDNQSVLTVYIRVFVDIVLVQNAVLKKMSGFVIELSNWQTDRS